jgi:hypothetical protein
MAFIFDLELGVVARMLGVPLDTVTMLIGWSSGTHRTQATPTQLRSVETRLCTR